MSPTSTPKQEMQLTTEFEHAEQSPGYLLWRCTNRWQAAIRATLKPFGLTHVQFVLLASLLLIQTDGPVTQRHLSEHAATDPMMTSQVLRALETRGLVKRSAFPGDNRAWSLRVSTKGGALVNRAIAEVERCDREFFASLGERQAELTKLLLELVI